MSDAFVLILGLFIGSFLHTLVYRLPKNISLLGRSACDHCGTKISVIGLIPVLGYLLYRGKCTSCQKKIPPAYPIIELCNSLLVWSIFHHTGPEWRFVFELIIWESLFMIALYDFETMEVFWVPVVVCIVFRGLMLGVIEPQKTTDSLIGMFAGAGIFHFLSFFYLIIRRRIGLGEGDTTLMGTVGFVVTWNAVIPVIFISSVVGLVLVGGMIVLRRMSPADPFPFGPAIIIAGFLVYFYPGIVLVGYNTLLTW